MFDTEFPTIQPVFDSPSIGMTHAYYCQAIRDCLNKVLPSGFFSSDSVQEEVLVTIKENLDHILPIVKTVPSEDRQDNISFFLLAHYRPNAFKFFFEMFSRWLVPGKRLEVALLYATDFRILELGEEVYTICELMISVDDPADLSEIHCNLPIIEMEVRTGVESAYHARRILEVKGLTADGKTAAIQEYVSYFVRKQPKTYDRDLFTEMQHVLVICHDSFKNERDSRLLSRIIGSHYVFRKDLLAHINEDKEKRHLRLRIFRSKIRRGGEWKSVLSVLVGLNFLKEKEIFEEQHLMKAIQNYLPSLKAVEGSFFANRRGRESVTTIYLEVEKLDNQQFTSSEIKLLRRELVVDLKDRIGHLMHPVFMPRNEEEIMRNVLTLSKQVKYLRDIPQVNISFDEQTHNNLFFNVILVRVVSPGSHSMEELFANVSCGIDYIHDRCKMLGMLKKKYTKEATVFRVKLEAKQFHRQDHSIDLYKARQYVVDELTRVVGEFRDFNGGMISKQNELLCRVRELLEGESVKYNDLLFENFFYSMTPVIMRTVLEAEALKTLFLMLLEVVKKRSYNEESSAYQIKRDERYVYAMITTRKTSLQEDLSKALLRVTQSTASLASTAVTAYDTPCLGYIFRSDDPYQQEQFSGIIEMTLREHEVNQEKAELAIR